MIPHGGKAWLFASALALTAGCSESERSVEPGAQASTSPGSGAPPSSSPSVGVSAEPGVNAPPSPLDPPAAPSPPGGAERALAVYYLGDTGRRAALYREFRQLPAQAPIHSAVDAVLHLAPLDSDYISLWPEDTRILGISQRGDLAVVDLSLEAEEGRGGSEVACASLQQLVWTVTAAAPEVERVEVRVDGEARGVVSEFWGAGCGRDEPLRRSAPSYEILAPIQIIAPHEGQAGPTGTLRFSGDASVFEATVSWRVKDLTTGEVVEEGFSTASEGAPGRGEWSGETALPASLAGHRLEIRAWEDSAEDGRDLHPDTKTVRVSSE